MASEENNMEEAVLNVPEGTVELSYYTVEKPEQIRGQ